MPAESPDDIETSLHDIDAQLRGGDHDGAYRALRAVLGYPAARIETDALFARAAKQLATLSRTFGAVALADKAACVAATPNDPNALFDAAYGFYEARQFEVAATLLARANRVAPGQPPILAELAMCLERLHRHGEAALTLDVSGTPERDAMCAYLSGFHWLMSGDLDIPRRRVAQLVGVEEGPIPFLRAALAAMIARADAVLAAGLLLDERALSAWQAVLSGTLLLHESPHGYDAPMHGRYAFVSDSPALMREGLERLAAFLADAGQRPSRVVAAPCRASRILARAAAHRLGLAYLDWTPGAESNGLVVAWSMETIEDTAFLQALHAHAPAQRLFVHASCWTEPFTYAPDLTTFLHQAVTNPYTGGAMRVDANGDGVTRAEPDPRDDETLAREILSATAEDDSVTAAAQVLTLSRAFTKLPDDTRPGFLRTTGLRIHQRAGNAVPSARFT